MYKQFYCSSFVTAVYLLCNKLNYLHLYVNLILKSQVSAKTMIENYTLIKSKFTSGDEISVTFG